MKEFKKDIFEIMFKVKGLSIDDSESLNILEKLFEDIFKEFYEKERNMEFDEEVVNLFLLIVSGESVLDEIN